VRECEPALPLELPIPASSRPIAPPPRFNADFAARSERTATVFTGLSGYG
jgi:hypothetical protein